MCPPLSCCLSRSAGHLPTLLYYLGRLLLTRPDELTLGQARRLPARLDALWHRCYTGFGQRPDQHWLYSPELASQLIGALLERGCCRQALRRRVPLAEALGAPGRRRWPRRVAALRLRATTRRATTRPLPPPHVAGWSV